MESFTRRISEKRRKPSPSPCMNSIRTPVGKSQNRISNWPTADSRRSKAKLRAATHQTGRYSYFHPQKMRAFQQIIPPRVPVVISPTLQQNSSLLYCSGIHARHSDALTGAVSGGPTL